MVFFVVPHEDVEPLVAPAHAGATALFAIDVDVSDLVMTDLAMPHGDGRGLARGCGATGVSRRCRT